jgi:peptidoglycan LD-endopeptidase LytH
MAWAPYSNEPQRPPTPYTDSPNSALSLGGISLPSNWWRALPWAAQAEQGVQLARDIFGGLGPGTTPTTPGYTKGWSSTYGVGQETRPRGPFDKAGGYQSTYSPIGERPTGAISGFGGFGGADKISGAQGGGAPDPGFNFLGQGGDVVADSWQEQYDRYIAGMQAEEDMVRAGYSPTIEGLSEELGDLRAAAAALGIPFDEYIAQRQAIGADVGDAPGLSASMKPVITKIYDDADAEMKAVYKQIDMNFGPKVTAGIVNKMKDFEGTIEDVIRTDEASIDLLHEKSSEYAKALAQSAFSNDIYAALDAETKINAQLDSKIEDTAEELSRQKKAMQAAMDAARDRFASQYEFEEPDFDTVWQETLNEYFESNNVPPHERQAAMSLYQQILEADPSYSLNEGSWRRGINEFMNQSAFNALGLTNDIIEQAVGETGNDAILQLMSSANIGGMFQKGQTASIEAALARSGIDPQKIPGIIARGLRNADSLPTTNSSEVTHLRNMYTSRTTLSENWEQTIAKWGPPVQSGDLWQAADGYTFPVAGGAKYSHDWHNPRGGGTRQHEGIDLFANKGTPAVASTGGVVHSIDYGNLGGNYVKIKAPDGSIHYYAHLDKYANISVGQKVRPGMVIGYVGNTGNARSTPPHLHYGIYVGGKAVDPYHYVQAAKQGSGTPKSYAYGSSSRNYGSGGQGSSASSSRKSYSRDKRARYA